MLHPVEVFGELGLFRQLRVEAGVVVLRRSEELPPASRVSDNVERGPRPEFVVFRLGPRRVRPEGPARRGLNFPLRALQLVRLEVYLHRAFADRQRVWLPALRWVNPYFVEALVFEALQLRFVVVVLFLAFHKKRPLFVVVAKA